MTTAAGNEHQIWWSGAEGTGRHLTVTSARLTAELPRCYSSCIGQCTCQILCSVLQLQRRTSGRRLSTLPDSDCRPATRTASRYGNTQQRYRWFRRHQILQKNCQLSPKTCQNSEQRLALNTFSVYHMFTITLQLFSTTLFIVYVDICV